MLEGDYRLKYFVIQWIKEEMMFTVTITDSETDFARNVHTFGKIADSIKFIQKRLKIEH